MSFQFPVLSFRFTCLSFSFLFSFQDFYYSKNTQKYPIFYGTLSFYV